MRPQAPPPPPPAPARGLAMLLLLLLASPPPARAVDVSQCVAPLGMESGAIADEDISASSSFDSGNVGPQNGRVRTERQGGAWCPKQQATMEPKEWLEVDLRQVHLVTATETQGRFGNGQGQEFAEAYMLEYWRPKLGKWVRYRDSKGREVLKGNSNTYLESKQQLEPAIWASRVRFLPYSYHRRTVCMRVELYGCRWTDGVVSYSMPQGDKRGAGWELFDATYDGHWDGELRRGLGQLTDGRVAADSFRPGHYPVLDKGQGWVGWRNDSRGGQPVEIKFEFDKVREFNAVHIFCNNQFTRDVQVFSEANVLFSVGGKHYDGEPITYTYIEDCIFENSRNISIKLHHRVGRFVKLRLHFANRWIMISEVTFDSVVAHGNFSEEVVPVQDAPAQTDVFIDRKKQHVGGRPVSTATEEEHTYLAVIIGVLMALVLLLAAAISLIVSRHRQRKCFASPLAAKVALAPTLAGAAPATGTSSAASAAGTAKSGASFAAKEVGGAAAGAGAAPAGCGRSWEGTLDPLLVASDYQEPYHALKYAPYYSYSSVLVDVGGTFGKRFPMHDEPVHDYAVPDTGVRPPAAPSPSPAVSLKDTGSLLSRDNKTASKGKKSPCRQEALSALRRRLQQTAVPEFPRHRLRMLSRLAEGAFGTVYIAEADGVPEYGKATTLGKRLVAVKLLPTGAADQEKQVFLRDVHILAALEDANLARVLGLSSSEEPLAVVMEYLQHGDLTQFLRAHQMADDDDHLLAANSLSFNCLLYMACQIASGMRYLETLNFVHRDLATRNCLVGEGYQVKVCDFGTHNELYEADYCKVDGVTGLPVRWMAWESVLQGQYTTKSDVWSFGVTLWEVLTLARRRPLEPLSDAQVLAELARLGDDDNDVDGCALPLPLAPPPRCSSDVLDLLDECRRRHAAHRPSFREIHLFLQRKTLGYVPRSAS
ncbi:discoidin domain-containing receptor tyrosine kinase B-like [Schistocerca americana]|uniref:discoidin domain-containing receptor tyrosine kinase B-like n=1 Tax=Schistocerca americana TaxID=7009 RepID=UPI001F4F6211|nr:discoidin domain-containing receptor tyrosine kinase B-like [Schistocerca americana]